MKRLLISTCLVALVSVCGVANGDFLVNVDFEPNTDDLQTGAGVVVGSAGDVWNSSDETAGMALVDSAGNATGVTMTMDAEWPAGKAVAGFERYQNTPQADLMIDGVFGIDATPVTVTLTGVAAGEYDLYAYSGSNNGDPPRVTLVTANGVSKTIGPNSAVGTLTLVQGADWEVLGVTVGGDQTLSIVGSVVSGGASNLTGFQLSQIPEPSTLILGLLGAVSLVAYAWRKRR